MLAAVFGRAVSVLVVPFSVPSLGLDVVVVVPLDSAPSCLSHSLTLTSSRFIFLLYLLCPFEFCCRSDELDLIGLRAVENGAENFYWWPTDLSWPAVLFG